MHRFRTLATDISFHKRVKEDMLVRLLDAFAWNAVKGNVAVFRILCQLTIQRYSFNLYRPRRPQIQLCTRHERVGWSFPLHYAIGTRGLL